jgi:ElaA protein
LQKEPGKAPGSFFVAVANGCRCGGVKLRNASFADVQGDSVTETTAQTRTPGTEDLTWQWSRFDDLTPRDLYEVVRLREAVFIVEQNCPYPDADGRDPQAWHLLGWVEDGSAKKLVAYARLFEPGVRYTECSIGRIVSAPEVRGAGFGRALLDEGLRRLESLAPRQAIKIAAQRRLENFYKEYGFKTVSEPYEEDGIIHVDMLR